MNTCYKPIKCKEFEINEFLKVNSNSETLSFHAVSDAHNNVRHFDVIL